MAPALVEWGGVVERVERHRARWTESEPRLWGLLAVGQAPGQVAEKCEFVKSQLSNISLLVLEGQGEGRRTRGGEGRWLKGRVGGRRTKGALLIYLLGNSAKLTNVAKA